MAVRRSSPRSPTFLNGQDVNTNDVCPAALGTKDQQPAAYSPLTKLFYVPTNHVCMDYEPFKVEYTAGQPYVGATLSMYPPKGESHMGNFIAWDASTGKIVWSNKEQFSVWSGVLTTAGGIACVGTLEGYFKCVDQKDGKELYQEPHSFRHHRQRLHLRSQGQAVHRHLLGCWWLGWHRSRGWSHEPDRRSRRRWWLRWSEQLHRSRWLADHLDAAIS